MTATNRAVAERQRKEKEDDRRKKQQKLHTWERGEESDSDEDDDEEEEEEVVTDTKWDNLESEDTLTGIPSSMQGPFPFHAGGSESVRMAEAGRTVGPSLEQVGAGGSATAPEVSVKGSGPAVVP